MQSMIWYEEIQQTYLQRNTYQNGDTIKVKNCKNTFLKIPQDPISIELHFNWSNLNGNWTLNNQTKTFIDATKI